MIRAVRGSLRRLTAPLRDLANDSARIQARALGRSTVRVIVDVGANVGLTVSRYRRQFPRARIIAFEPFPESLSALESRFARDPLVQTVGTALAERAGEAVLYVDADRSRNSLLSHGLPDDSGDRGTPAPEATCTVRVARLDDVLEARGVETVDILKIDAEGAELRVLRGAARALARGSIRAVFTEVMFLQHYEEQPLFVEVASYLENSGFLLHDIRDLRRGRSGRLRFANALFLRGDTPQD